LGEITEKQPTNIIAIDNPFDCIQFNNLTVILKLIIIMNQMFGIISITSEFILIKATITPGNF